MASKIVGGIIITEDLRDEKARNEFMTMLNTILCELDKGEIKHGFIPIAVEVSGA